MRGNRTAQRLVAVVLMYSALIVSGCGKSSNPTTPTPGSGSGNGTAGNPITVFITNSVYSPNPLTVKAGQFVNFKNNDANRCIRPRSTMACTSLATSLRSVRTMFRSR